MTQRQHDKPPTIEQWRELQAMIRETDRLLRLLGEDPDAPVDLTELIAKGQDALDAVLAASLDESPRTHQCESNATSLHSRLLLR